MYVRRDGVFGWADGDAKSKVAVRFGLKESSLLMVHSDSVLTKRRGQVKHQILV